MEIFSSRSLLASLRGKVEEARPLYVPSDSINYESVIFTKLTVLAVGWGR